MYDADDWGRLKDATPPDPWSPSAPPAVLLGPSWFAKLANPCMPTASKNEELSSGLKSKSTSDSSSSCVTLRSDAAKLTLFERSPSIRSIDWYGLVLGGDEPLVDLCGRVCAALQSLTIFFSLRTMFCVKVVLSNGYQPET